MRIEHKNLSYNEPKRAHFEVLANDITHLAIKSLKSSDFLQKWEKHENMMFYTHSGFNVIDILFFAINEMQPVDVWLTSFSFTNEVADKLNILVNAKQISSLWLMLDYRVQYSRPDLIHQLNNIADDVIINKNHSKLILLCNNENKEYLSIVSSANLNRNPRDEAGCISRSYDTFSFYKNIFDQELKKKHGTI